MRGLTLFLVGLEKALFPLGENIAEQLTANARRLPRVRSIWVFPLATRVRLDRVENRVAVLICVNAGCKIPSQHAGNATGSPYLLQTTPFAGPSVTLVG